ncbi:MAG: T9SS type A sorting domain-containing protein [Bacteroidia bacterium]|nr:T9SS type A sorting domain-containing protein [Bacteroidia bacterium]
MIKKLLLSVSAILTFAFNTSAQICTPNVSCVPASQTYGACPDSTTGLAIGTVGVPYTQTVSIKVPADGSDFGFPIPISDITIVGVDSLAPGLIYQCAPSNCVFPGGTNGCILISGTPTQVWHKKIIVRAEAHNTTFGLTIPETNEQYFSTVIPATGINDLNMSKFDVHQNSPNPFSERTEIYFSSLDNSQIEFKVYNLVGALVYNNKFNGEKGVNTIRLEANSFAPGVYIYSVKNGNQTITKRMVVTSK